MIELRIALSIPDLHESEGDLQKRAMDNGDAQIMIAAYFVLGERSETGSSVPGSWVLWN